jgi:hypothetical protein
MRADLPRRTTSPTGRRYGLWADHPIWGRMAPLESGLTVAFGLVVKRLSDRGVRPHLHLLKVHDGQNLFGAIG